MKTQLKKSLSLFLAVLMLMSCWVWVAPTEAEAANSPHEGYYFVQVIANVTDWTAKMDGHTYKWTCYYKENNGTGSTEKNVTLTAHTDQLLSSNKTNAVIASGWVYGFPTRVVNDWSCTKNADGFTVAQPRIYVGDGSTISEKVGERGDQWSCAPGKTWYGSAAANSGSVETTVTGAAPVATKTKNASGTVETKSIDVPNLGATNNGSVAFTKAGVYDQYGVKMSDVTEYAFYADNAGTGAEYTQADHGIWVSGTTAYASEKAQKGIPNSSGSQKVYLFAKHGEIKGCIAEITLKYPSYTVTVDSKGSVTASGFNPTIILNNSTQTGNWTHTGPYGSAAASYPNGEATATGYTFKGFWTEKQPTTGDAGISASEATFAAPVDQTTFDTYKAQEGATVNGSYVTLADGKKYYNAGTQWDGAVHKEILGANTFYAWWVPKDIVVKFYDIDGAFLGTKTTKYGTKPAADWYLNPKDGYNAGAYDYQGFAGKWRDITGVEVVEGSYTFGALEELSLTPIYTDKTYSDKYQVNFVNPADGNNISGNSKEYQYRYILNGTDIPTVAVPSVLVNDAGYSYEFGGWTSQKPAKGNYHTVAKNDTAITENTDWVVRDEITYYAIFRSTVKEYLVNFNYTDSTGAAKTESLTVPYGSAIATPNVVNRTYATGGYGYTLEGWDYQTNTGATAMLGADATLVFDKTKVFITTNNLAPNGTPIVFTANYDEGKPTPYTVTFKFKDAEGKDKVITDEVYHGYAITQEIVDRISVPAQYDDGTALYTFSNLWKVTEGTADKAEYTKDEFTSFKPVSHVTFEALYGEGVPFYTVTYIDGAKKYEERVLAGNNVPAWLVEVGGVKTEYAPAMADTETGKYNFEGWFNEEQTDKNFAQTNGTEYTTASIVNGDLVLYPQFKFEPFKFTIKFMNYNGTVQLAAAEVEAGKSFEATFVEAQKAAKLRDADATYSYEFIGWDHKVPDNFLCEGKDMTYTALYKPNYIYYEANWYKTEAGMEANSVDELLATTKHTYNGAVYAPSVDLEIISGEVFDGWYYKDGTEEKAYQRGMTITASMSFYAKTKPAPLKGFKITAVIGTSEIEHSIERGDDATVIGTPPAGYVDETSHNKFAGWYTEATYDNVFDPTAVVTEDITVYAKFETAAHSKTMKELVSAPTYYAAGSEIIWCECNREKTDETVEIPMLTDTKAPTGTIYLGGHSWSSTGTPAYTTDNDPISVFVNANADIVITSNDTGDVNTAYNPSGIGKGVAKIRAFAFPANTVLTADNYGAAQSLAVDVYTNDTQDLNNNANFSIKVGDIFVADLTADGEVQYDDKGNVKYKALEDGESYIVYYYVNDKAGNQLNRLVRTAKFTYDNTPAEITVAGDSNAATATSTVTYCGKAVIKGIENGSTVLVNGEEVALTTSGVSGTTAYTISEAGNYAITVIDQAGNAATKKIIVADGHDEIATSKAVTCTEDGYDKVICAVCGKVLKNETIKSEGHKYSAEVTVAPTCTEDGYTIKTCSVCGDEVKTPGEAKTGHTYNKDADGNVIYVTVTPSTCKVKGKAEAKCTVCGEGKLEKELELDTVNGHKYGATKVLKATCTQDGEEYQNCKYCYAKKTVKVLEKLNHVGTGTYTKVTTAPTCYAEGVETTYCKGCDAKLSTATVAKVAHTLVLVKYEGENNDDVANYPYGYMQYECKATGCTHTEGKTAIVVKAEYTVTFVGAGAEGADVVITKTEGESIEADAVADQTKADDNEYVYTFKGWKAESTGKIVKLPVKVTKNETYTAEFTATKRVYTHRFKINEEDEAAFAVIIGTYNSENKKPAAIPTKAATPTERYEFTGWKTVLGAEVDDNFTMTGDKTFVAEFKTIKTEFNAIFYNEDNNLIWHTSVTAGETVKYANTDSENNLIVPTKAADADAHYNFAGWEYDGDVYGIDDKIANDLTNNIRIYATYTAEAHKFVTVEDATWAATCEKAGQTTEKCSACGYEKVTAIPVADHKYELQTDGSKMCTVCGDTIAPEAKLVKLTFKYGDDKSFTIEVAEGKEYTFTATEKKDTAEFDYSFSHWEDEAKNIVSKEATITVTAGNKNATYTAEYSKVTRYYYVTYVNWDYTTLQTFKDKYAYGATIPEYTSPAPTRDRDNTNHYIFEGEWSVEANAKVTGDMVIIARFTAQKHDTLNTISEAATCTTPATTYKACSKCDYREVTGTTGTTLPHTPKAGTEKVDPAGYNKPGSRTFECASCGQTITETLAAIPADIITVRVYDNDGKLAINGAARVELYEIADGKEIFFKAYDTNDKGEVEFAVEKGKKWKAGVTGDNMEGGYGGEVKHGLNIFGKAADTEPEKPSDTSCSCSCHKNTFWGIIYRFFQKLVMWLTGSPKCCGNPDDRIW